MFKNFIVFLSTIPGMAIALSGCIEINSNGVRFSSIYGSGEIITEERQVAGFNQIHLRGAGNVFLTRASFQQVQVETDDNIMPHIGTRVDDSRLIISHVQKNLRPTVLNIHITTPDLEGVSISGSGDISGNEEFRSVRFYTDIAGSGDIALKVSADRLESNISGSGSVYLAGSATFYDATITGSGDVDAFDLQVKESSIVITGSGNCRVSVLDRLTARITGSGDVLYKGHPRLSQSITGSGKVKDRN